MTFLKWTSRIAVVVTTALSVWRLWKAWQAREHDDSFPRSMSPSTTSS